MIGWGLHNGRMVPGVRMSAVKLLDGVVRLCMKTAEFRLLMRTDISRGLVSLNLHVFSLSILF